MTRPSYRRLGGGRRGSQPDVSLDLRSRRVLIVGAGFAGFECARQLIRSHPDHFEITLVNPTDYFLYTPLLPDVAGGMLDPRQIAVPLAESLPGVRIVTGTVKTLAVKSHRAEVAISGMGGRTETLAWDRLVLTPGSVTKLIDIPGLAEHALGLKSLASAIYLRDHLLGQLEKSVVVDEAGCRACRTVVVVGASYSGTELIAQLRGLAGAAARRHRFDPEEMRFVLLDVADRVMPEVGPRLAEHAVAGLKRQGIEVRLGTTLRSVTKDAVTLDDGTHIPCSTVAWVAGVTANPLIETLGLPLQAGRLVVDGALQNPEHEGLFSGGDAAAVPDLTRPGEITPPVAQHAVRQGRVMARNVAASFGYGTPTAYRHHDLGLVVDLGPGDAVANPLGIRLSGLPAKVVARAYHLYALPRWSNRLGVGLAYLTDAVSPSHLVSLGLVPRERAGFDDAEHLRVIRNGDG